MNKNIYEYIKTRNNMPKKSTRVTRTRRYRMNVNQYIQRGALLGRGEYGMVHEDATNQNNVVKTVLFTPRYDPGTGKYLSVDDLEEMFMKEGKIQQEMGQKEIAPMVYYYGTTIDDGEKKGIIIMEKMSGIYRSRYPDIGDNPNVIEPAVLPPASVQHKVIKKMIEMIDAGYIHNDLHGGNIGFVRKNGKDEVRLFDYGFSHAISPLCLPCNKDQILGFSLYQLIEHLPFELRDKSVYYDVIYDLRQNKDVFGQYRPEHEKTKSLKSFKRSHR
jgi:hypothetical protein